MPDHEVEGPQTETEDGARRRRHPCSRSVCNVLILPETRFVNASSFGYASVGNGTLKENQKPRR